MKILLDGHCLILGPKKKNNSRSRCSAASPGFLRNSRTSVLVALAAHASHCAFTLLSAARRRTEPLRQGQCFHTFFAEPSSICQVNVNVIVLDGELDLYGPSFSDKAIKFACFIFQWQFAQMEVRSRTSALRGHFLHSKPLT